jgi:hypothetical protein
VNHLLAPPTPLSPAALVEDIREVCGLLDRLVTILDLGLPPPLEELRGELEVALERPESLQSAQNQLDLVEELAEAVWGEPPIASTARGLAAAGLPRTERRLLAESLARLDELSERLCRDTEAWHRRRVAAAGSTLTPARHSPA